MAYAGFMEKNKSLIIRKLGWLVAALCFLFIVAGPSPVEAREGHRNYNSRSQYQKHYSARDRNVYRDRHGRYHRYEYRNNRRGYWNHHNGLRFWININ